MFKGNIKRAFAWVMALCMIVALLPIVPVQTAYAVKDDTGAISYALNTYSIAAADAHGNDTTMFKNSKDYVYFTTTAGTGVTELGEYVKNNVTYEKTLNTGKKRAEWKASSVYVSSFSDTSTSADKYSASPSWARLYSGYGVALFVYGNVTNRIARAGVTLKVNQGEEGWYNISTSYYFPKRETDNATLTFTVYDGTAAEGTVKGEAFSTNSVATNWATGDLGVAYFAPGEYEITLEMKTTGATSSGANKNNLAVVRNVKLTPAEAPVSYSITPTGADANLQDYTLEVGESGSATFALLEGTSPVSDAAFTAVSKNTAVADVAVSGNKVTVTAKSAGSADIEVTGTCAGGSAKTTVTVRVNAAAPVERKPLTYSFSGMYNSAWTEDNSSLSGVKSVWLKDGKNGDLKEVLTYDYTSGKGSEPWKLTYAWVGLSTGTFDNNSGPNLTNEYGFALNGYSSSSRDNEVGVVLKVKEGTSGLYNAVLNMCAFSGALSDNASSVKATIALYKGTSADDSKKLAEISPKFTMNSSSVKLADTAFGEVTLEPGEYYLKLYMDIVSTNSKTNRVFVKSLTFTPIEEEKEYTVTPTGADANLQDYTLEVGESGSATFALLEGTSPVSDAAFTAVSKNTAVADVAVSGNKVTVTAKSVGSADIEVTGTCAGGSAKTTVTVQVIKPAAKIYTYNFTGMYNSAWTADNTMHNADGALLKDGANGAVMDTFTYDYTSSKGSEPWKITDAAVATTDGKFIKNAGVYTTNDLGFILNAYNSSSYDNEVGIVLKVKEGVTGWHEIKANVAAYTQATDGKTVKATFSLYKGTSANAENLIAEHNPTFKVGGVNITFTDRNIGTVKLEPGEYYLKLRLDVISSNSKTNRVIVKNLTFTEADEPNDYAIAITGADASLQDYAVEVGETGTATLQLRNAGFPLEGGTFTAVAENTDILTVAVSGNKVTVTGKKPGKSKVTLKAMDGDKTIATTEVEIDVIAMQYNFTFLNSTTANNEFKNVTDYSMTATSGLDPWCFGFQNDKTNTFRLSSPQGYGSVIAQQIGTAAGIKVNIDQAGIYTPEMIYGGGSNCGIMRMYIAPVDAENYIASEYSVGHADTWKVKNGTKSVFRSVYLEKGEYIIAWEIIGSNPQISGAPRLFLTTTNLIGINEYPEITISHEELGEIKLGNHKEIALTAVVADGSSEDLVGAEFRCANADSSIAKIEAVYDAETYATKLKVTGYKLGSEDIPVDVYVKGVKRASLTLPVNIVAPAALKEVSVDLRENVHDTLVLRKLLDVKGHLDVVMTDEDDQPVSELSAQLQNVTCTFTSSDESVATIDGEGVITPITSGTTTLRCTVKLGAVTKYDEIELTVHEGKDRSSYYTEERVNAVRENIANYGWAKSSVNSTIKEADLYVGKVEQIYDLITTQELPRSYYAAYRIDPTAQYCNHPACGENLQPKYGLYPWLYNAVTSPWKIQCPECRRKFPANDFGSFYALGIVNKDEAGMYTAAPGHWSYEKAHFEHYKKFASEYAKAGIVSYEDYDAKRKAGERMPGVGYLKNTQYPELGDTWGVDDGYGYVTDKTFTANGFTLPEVDAYIACYNHWAVWYDQSEGAIGRVMDKLRDAYVFTGELKYGRAGAILLDRVADIYPELSTMPYVWYMTTTNKMVHGKGIDKIWDTHMSRDWAKAYDAFFPVYEDEQVISFLSAKAEKYGLENPKSNPSLLREHCETNILREIYIACQDAYLRGNFGMMQSALGTAAVVLDSIPETVEMLDWVFQNGEGVSVSADTYDMDYATGGDVMRTLINETSRDGTNDEIAPNYMRLWYAYLNMMLDVLAGYDKYPDADLFNNPRYIKLLEGMVPLTLSRSATAQIADSGRVADQNFNFEDTTAKVAFQYTKKPIFAQMIYFLNGNKTDGLHYDMYTPDPERLAREVQEVIDTYGEYPFDDSTLLAGYGFAALRGGTKVEAKHGVVDTQRTFWMSFTRGYVGKSNSHSGHNHFDGLNLGIEAYGLNVAPELGYPENLGTDQYRNYGKSTVIHNTVVVNGKHQTNTEASKPLHFDDSGKVKLIDVDASDRYAETDKYRRTVVSIDINDEIAYGVDFFHVKGGDEHVYSFHALNSVNPEFVKIDGSEIALVPQKSDTTGDYIGTYQGADVAFGTKDSVGGFAWLYDVDRASDAGKEFSADFKIDDIRDKLKGKRDMHLKLTMLNSFDMSEVAFASADPQKGYGNPESIRFMLAKRSGKNLDTTFTSVIEPYDGESNIEKIEKAALTDKSGNPVNSENAKALKVTLKDGRVDYIVYSEDNTKEYIVDGRIEFCGFLGVYTEQDGENIYSYLNDGSKLNQLEGKAALEGAITDFTTGLKAQNYITVKFDNPVNCDELVGEHLYAAKCARGNGVYKILGAEVIDEANNVVELDIGDISLIDKLADSEGIDFEYTYNIEAGTRFRIPFGVKMDSSPIIEQVQTLTATAGKKFSYPISAASQLDGDLTYKAVHLPRGAAFNEETATFSWTPDNNQLGTNLVGVRVSEGGLSSVVYFRVNVINSSAPIGGSTPSNPTTPSTPSTPSNPSTPSGGSSGGSSGGASGGSSSGGASSGGSSTPSAPSTDVPGTPDSGDTNLPSTEKFTDLGNHAWAKDAVYALVDAGVVNGTSATTFSPAANIKRADFAIMMVRAFKLESDSAENFADVDAGTYYAKELAIAKACGIINGVGENKFNPDGEITRQDMMLMITRALDAVEYGLTEADRDVLEQFADAADIVEYAADAASRVVKAGIITGANGKLNPLAKATRAEVAVMLERVLKSEK